MGDRHRYLARCSWRGSTGIGYEGYRREHEASAPPAEGTLALSSDPAFRGRPEHLNPEQLVVLAASSCQLLAFLAVAARARIDVLEYDDEAEGVMPEDDRPLRITRIVLRPRIVVAARAERGAGAPPRRDGAPRVLRRQLTPDRGRGPAERLLPLTPARGPSDPEPRTRSW